jgi:hypothetical protein
MKISSIVLAAMVCGVAEASQSIVTNGDFESPVVNGPFIQRDAGSAMGGWVVTGHSIDQIGSYWHAARACSALHAIASATCRSMRHAKTR